jgi:hypothetical protein
MSFRTELTIIYLEIKFWRMVKDETEMRKDQTKIHRLQYRVA